MSDYSVKGDLHIEFRDTNLAALVRDLPDYISRNRFLGFLDTEELAETDASQLLERILGEWNFYLILSKHKLMIDRRLPGNDNYTVMHFGVSSDINVNYLDSFLAFLGLSLKTILRIAMRIPGDMTRFPIVLRRKKHSRSLIFSEFWYLIRV